MSALDNMELPRFVVVREDLRADRAIFRNWDPSELDRVYAINATHRNPAYLTGGDATFQTPFGQGIHRGIRVDVVRDATWPEIRAAILMDHPYGWTYRPGPVDMQDSLIALILTDPTGPNLAVPGPFGTPEILSAREKARIHRDLRDRAEIAAMSHAELLAQWAFVADRQRRMLFTANGEHYPDDPIETDLDVSLIVKRARDLWFDRGNDLETLEASMVPALDSEFQRSRFMDEQLIPALDRVSADLRAEGDLS